MTKVFKTAVLLAMLMPVNGALSAPTQHAFHFTEAYKLAIKLNQEADDKMFDNMQLISDWFAYHKDTYGRFPEAGTDQEKAEQFCRRYLRNNPYSATGVQTRAETGRACVVRFECNPLMTRKLIEAWELAPPPGWRAEPGTITVITNSENLVAVWAAGADRKPLIDARNGKVRFSVAELVQAGPNSAVNEE
ncbi:MAG: hypothetical protein K2W95_00585 [Candidatus Obscuribacterales bacterium]|nr:hypothetical protein [Candidatus Obscuribacterales bacterium]